MAFEPSDAGSRSFEVPFFSRQPDDGRGSRLRGGPLARLTLLVGALLALGACEAALTEPAAGGSAVSFEVAPSEAEGFPGDTIHFEATVTDGSGDAVTGYEIGWSSSDTDLVTVDGTGVATVRDSGSATLTATATSTSGDTELTASARVRGKGKKAASVEVTPSEATVGAGDTVQLDATVRDGNGDALDRNVQFSSSDPSVATVDGDGTVTGQAAGTAEIKARSGSARDTATITVEGGGGGSSGSGTLVTDVEPVAYETDTLEAGIAVYVDRDYAVEGVPSSVAGWTYVRTANGDKTTTGDSAITFELADSATVAVAYDDFASSLPTWLGGWTDTGEAVQTSIGTFSVFTRAFDAGDVALAGNMSDGAEGTTSMYLVLASRADSSADGGGSDGGDGGDPTTVPSAPSGLSVGATSSSRVTGSFTDNADDESGFEVERNDGTGWMLAAELGADDTDFSDTGLSPETTYSYRVRAVNAAGASEYSNVAEATTPAESTSGSGEHPNEPAGMTTIFEADGSTHPPGENAADKTVGAITGTHFVFEDGRSDAMTVQSVSTAPETPSGVLDFLYPEGLSAGSGTPAIWQVWDANADAALNPGSQYAEVYEHGWVRTPASDFEFSGIVAGIKFLGYYGVGDGDAALPTQFIVGAPNPDGSCEETVCFRNDWPLEFTMQDHTVGQWHSNLDQSDYWTAGEWHEYELILRVNDPGEANGEIHLWWNGVKVAEHFDVVFRTVGDERGFWGRRFDLVYGGGDLTTNKTRDDHVQFDHVYISGIPMN